MRAGQLRHVCTLQIKTSTKNEYGEATEMWANHMTIRCKRTIKGGNKEVQDYEMTNTETITLLVYYRSTIMPDMRVLFNNRIYKLLLIEELGYKDSLILHCEYIPNAVYTAPNNNYFPYFLPFNLT